MATINVVTADGPFGRGVTFTWGPMANGDQGKPVYVGNLKDLSVQGVGTVGTTAIEGSNDGVNFVALTTAVAVAATVSVIGTIPAYLRPNAGAGATGLTVIVSGKRDNQ